VIRTVDGAVRVAPGTAQQPDATLSGTPALIIDVLTRQLDLAIAQQRGLTFAGDPKAIGRIARRCEQARTLA
jgi:hypothetical protein